MKRFLAILCTLAMLLSVLPSAAFAAENSDLQAAMDDDSSEIIVLEEDTSNLTVNRDTYLDLNGHDLDGVSVLAGTLYLMDSATADYTVADGVYGHVTNVTGNVKAADGYLQVGDSFHAVNLDIYAMTLRASNVGVYYKSYFAADEIVAAEVESFGVALSVVTAPSASNLETYCGYSVFTGFAAGEGANSAGSSTLLKGIMKAANGDEKNAKNAAMPVYGRAYIKTADGYFFGETVKRSLQEQVEAIDGVWEGLSDAQKAPVLSMLESYTAVMENWEIPNIQGIQVPGADEEIEIPIEVTAENGVVTETVTVEQNGVSITVPAGTKLAEGAASLTLTITPVEAEDTGLTLKENYVLTPMDVHVEGLAADNTQPLTIYLGKVMPENLNMGNYAVYHVENGSANEMTLIPATADFTAHNQYKYSLDGELTLHMASFSPMGLYAAKNNAWQGGYDYSWYTSDPKAETFYIRNADQLAAFGAIVGGMVKDENGEPIQKSFNTKVVKLLADIDLGDAEADNTNKIFYPIGYYYDEENGEPYCEAKAFKGTFDGNGHTIKNFYQNTWEMKGDYNGHYYNTAMGLFAYVYGATIKNLTVENFSSDGEFTPTGVIAAYGNGENLFENIAIRNCNPRVYNTGNGGIVGWDMGGDSDLQASKYTFRNISVDASNTITALWGSWDVACAGIMGYLGTHSKADLVNCHVAATIDVFNDVCGNYQYYWYRYCGMMIGTVDRTKADGSLDLINITASNCEVDFGDRHEYYYCEFVKNSQASYTHDYQFSRVKHSDLIFNDKNGNGVVDRNEVSTVTGCTHDHVTPGYDAQDYDGDGKQTLKEDKQAVHIPFRQLFGGYGWGVDGVDEYANIQIRDLTNSVEKFAPIYEGYVEPGQEITIGQLFAASGAGTIDADNVQVFVSPADDKSTADGVYTAVTPEENKVTDWTKGILTFSGYGKAVVSITDYNLCKTTKLELTVKSYTDDLQFIGETNEAFCPVCEAFVEWTEIAGGEKTTNVGNLVKGQHYYVAGDITYVGNSAIPLDKQPVSYISGPSASAELTGEDKVGEPACLHLNGKNITSTVVKDAKDYVIFGGNGRLNVMGSGKVASIGTEEKPNDGGPAVVCNTVGYGSVHLYSGTYESDSKSNTNAIAINNTGGKLVLHKDVVVNGGTNKKAIFIGTSGLRATDLQINGATINGDIEVSSPVLTTTGDYAKPKYPCYANAANTTVELNGAKISGTLEATYNKATTYNNSLTITVAGSTMIDNLSLLGTARLTLGELTEGANITVADKDGQITAEPNAKAKNYQKYFHTVDDSKYIAVGEDNHLYHITHKITNDLVFQEGTTNAYCVHCGAIVSWIDITTVGNGEYGVHKMLAGKHYYLSGDVIDNNTERAAFVEGPHSLSTGREACFHLNGKDITCTTKLAFFGSSGTLNIMGSGTVTGGTKGSNQGSAVAVNSYTGGIIKLFGGNYTDRTGTDSTRYTISINDVGGQIEIYEDATIDSVNGRAINVGLSTMRNSVLTIQGATINGNILVKSPAGDEEKKYAGNTNFGTAGQTEVLIDGATINGTVTVNNQITEAQANHSVHPAHQNVTISGATAMTKLVLQNAAKVTLGELDEAVNILVTASGAENKTITSADSGKIVYCEGGVIIVEAETSTEPETPTEPEAGTEEETTGA